MTIKQCQQYPCSGMVPLWQLLWEQLVRQCLICLTCALLILWRVHFYIGKYMIKSQIPYGSLKYLTSTHQGRKHLQTTKTPALWKTEYPRIITFHQKTESLLSAKVVDISSHGWYRFTWIQFSVLFVTKFHKGSLWFNYHFLSSVLSDFSVWTKGLPVKNHHNLSLTAWISYMWKKKYKKTKIKTLEMNLRNLNLANC